MACCQLSERYPDLDGTVGTDRRRDGRRDVVRRDDDRGGVVVRAVVVRRERVAPRLVRRRVDGPNATVTVSDAGTIGPDGSLDTGVTFSEPGTYAVFLATARLGRDRLRTTLAVVAVALAVLSVTLLGSLGAGVVETGQQKFDSADRDLWVSSGPLQVSPGTIGGFEGGIVDGHETGRGLSSSPSIDTASPLLFQTVYVGDSPESLRTVVAVGSTSSAGFQVRGGDGFGRDADFYNDGAYDGTPSRRTVLDDRLRSEFDVDVGDTLYVGGTTADARRTEYTVTGTSSTFSQFLGTPTVGLPLAELQAMTGSAHTDQASMTTVDVAADANVDTVHRRIEAGYPAYTVRTNTERLESIIGNRILIVAAGVVLTSVAVLSGIALTSNLLALLVAQKRPPIAAIRAVGVSRSVVAGMTAVQGAWYGLVGGLLGVSLTYPTAVALNLVTESIFGFEGLVRVSPQILVRGVSSRSSPASSARISLGGAQPVSSRSTSSNGDHTRDNQRKP